MVRKHKTSLYNELDKETVSAPSFGQGPDRAFWVTTPPRDQAGARAVSGREWRYVGPLVVFAAAVRLWNLLGPDLVVFDEVHFGGFASKYIRGTFFMDVHPPLAKMMYAGLGALLGFNGDFEFTKIGDAFPDTVPYVGMRFVPALMGVMTTLLFYLTLRASGCRRFTSLFASAAFAVENSSVTISRYILLDLPLLLFIAITVYGLKRAENETPFLLRWYRLLAAAGLGLGLAVSSKWVGLFTLAWAGVVCIWQLFWIWGDLRVKPTTIAGHFVARGSLLLGIPVVLYLLSFAVHFDILDKEGSGGAFMLPAFRTTLKGNTIPTNLLADVGIGSEVTIRHAGTTGGYLHSHPHMYETGSKQQQITLYPHLDLNNVWVIEEYNATEPPTTWKPLTDRTKIRLRHKLTHKRLHSHDEKPPVLTQDWMHEVTGYGFDGFEGDANDDFVVEIVKKHSKPGEAQERVRALETKFILKHAMTGYSLFSYNKKLPDWGFKQQEVVCALQGIASHQEWYVEANENPFLPADLERVLYTAPSFWQKLKELHIRMWVINRDLTESHHWQSLPDLWPLLLRGINYYGKGLRVVYLLGNAVMWWASTAALFAVLVHVLSLLIRWQRGAEVATNPLVFNFNIHAVHYFAGWLLHYLPSFLMGRQLFLHHYLPALYFAFLALAHTFDVIATGLLAKRRAVGYALITVFTVLSLAFYARYSALIYGGQWTKDQCTASKFLDWDFDCNRYPDTYDKYNVESSTTTAADVAAETAPPLVAVAEEVVGEQVEVEIKSEDDKPAVSEKFDTESYAIRMAMSEYAAHAGIPVPAEDDPAYSILPYGGEGMDTVEEVKEALLEQVADDVVEEQVREELREWKESVEVPEVEVVDATAQAAADVVAEQVPEQVEPVAEPAEEPAAVPAEEPVQEPVQEPETESVEVPADA